MKTCILFDYSFLFIIKCIINMGTLYIAALFGNFVLQFVYGTKCNKYLIKIDSLCIYYVLVYMCMNYPIYTIFALLPLPLARTMQIRVMYTVLYYYLRALVTIVGNVEYMQNKCTYTFTSHPLLITGSSMHHLTF